MQSLTRLKTSQIENQLIKKLLQEYRNVPQQKHFYVADRGSHNNRQLPLSNIPPPHIPLPKNYTYTMLI